MRTLTLVLSLLAAASLAAGSEADKLYKQARKAEKAGEIARAYILYSEAAALEPAKNIYALRAQSLQSRAAMQAKPVPKPVVKPPAEPDVIVEPEPHFDSPTAKDYAEARKPLPPNELKANPGRQDINLRGDFKTLFEQVAKLYGLDCVFDYEYQAGTPFRFELQQADYREALEALQATTASFVVPINARIFMVVKDTPQKRKEVEPSVSISIPLPEPTTAQDFTAMIAAVQQSLALEKVAWDTSKNMVVIRDRISKVTIARKLFDQLLQPRGQVEIEVEFVEWNRQDMLNYGMNLQTSFPLVNLTTFLHNTYSVPSGISGLALFGGGASLFGLGLGNAQLIANMTKSRAQTLLHADLRSVDGQPATIHVGDRYPVLTSGYFGPQSGGIGATGGTGAFGSGDGAVSYTVAANTGAEARTGTITIAGVRFTVTQPGANGGTGQTCTYTLSAATATSIADGTTGSVDIATASGCAWTAASTVTWITVTSGASGSADGTVAYTVAPNVSNVARTGTLIIGGQIFTVTQDGANTNCSYSLSPASQTFASSAGSGTVVVTTDAACAWSVAAPTVNWIAIISGQTGAGIGTVAFQVGENDTASIRTATLMIAGSPFLVTQQAAGTFGCSYSIVPTSVTVPATGTQSGTITVSSPYGCTWSPVSNVPWITITSGGAVSSGGSIIGTASYTPPPSFNFEDLGFSLKATPHIHGMGEVSLDLEAEFKLLAGTAVNGIPVVANRQVKSTVTLKEGEWALVAGLMTASEARTVSGIAGVMSVPLIGRFLRQNTNEKDGSEVIVVIRPRLVTAPPGDSVMDTVRVGSEERPHIPL